MHAILPFAMAALPSGLAMQQIRGERLNSLFSRQDVSIPRICSLVQISESDPNFCAASCGAGYRACPPAGERACYDHDGGQTCRSDGKTCPAGSYCSNKGCCRNGQSLEECGATATLLTTYGGPQTAMSPAGPPSEYGQPSPTPSPPVGYGSSSWIHPGSPPYSPTYSSWTSPSSSPPYYPTETSDTTSATPPGYTPGHTDTTCTTNTPTMYTPTTFYPPGTPSPYTPPPSPVSPSPYVPPPGYSTVTTDSWSSSTTTPPGYTNTPGTPISPTIPSAPGYTVNGTVYPAPQQTANAGVKVEVFGWAASGLSILVWAFFL